jgi:hypothetical protein
MSNNRRASGWIEKLYAEHDLILKAIEGAATAALSVTLIIDVEMALAKTFP